MFGVMKMGVGVIAASTSVGCHLLTAACQVTPPEEHPKPFFVMSLNYTCTVLQIADVVVARAEAGKNYGVVLVPEGLVE